MRAIHLALSGALFTAALGAQQPKTAAKKVPVATADSLKPSARATSGPWTASTKGKTYYRTGCSGANKLVVKNVIHFATEAEAQKAGYSRSRSKGC